MTHIKLYFLLAIFVALFSLGHSQNTNYRQVCARTTMSNLCTRIIDSSSSSVLKANAKGWLKILSDQIKKFAILTNTKIDDALRSNPSPRLRSCLQNCSEDYGFIVSKLDSLDWTTLNSANYEYFNLGLGQTYTDVTQCEATFDQPPPTPSPINVYTITVKNIIVVTLQFLNLIQCNKISACK